MGCKKSSESENLTREKAELYASAFDAVWNLNKELSAKAKIIYIDVESFKDFSEKDKEQLFSYIKDKYKVEVMALSYEEVRSAPTHSVGISYDGMYFFRVNRYKTYSKDQTSFVVLRKSLIGGVEEIMFDLEAVKKNNKWQIKKCEKY